jgi:hypothetical protein
MCADHGVVRVVCGRRVDASVRTELLARAEEAARLVKELRADAAFLALSKSGDG